MAWAPRQGAVKAWRLILLIGLGLTLAFSALSYDDWVLVWHQVTVGWRDDFARRRAESERRLAEGRRREEERRLGTVHGSMGSLFDGAVSGLAGQPDGKIVVAGTHNIHGVGIARLHPDGSLDEEFTGRSNGANAAELGGFAERLLLQPGGGILLIGSFRSRLRGELGLLRFGGDGALDESFVEKTADTVPCLDPGLGGQGAVALPDGGLALYASRRPRTGEEPPPCRLIRLLPVGSVNETWHAPPESDSAGALGSLPDGSVLIGRPFSHVRWEGEEFPILALDPRGNVDGEYSRRLRSQLPQPALLKYAMPWRSGTWLMCLLVPSPDLSEEGIESHRIRPVEVDEWGNLLSELPPAPLFEVHSAAAQGERTLVRGRLPVGTRPADGIRGDVFLLWRLDANGRIDAGFKSIRASDLRNTVVWNRKPQDMNPSISAVLVLRDGRIVIGGGFTSVFGKPRRHIARLTADGALEE